MKRVMVVLLVLVSLCVTASAVESILLTDLDGHGEFSKKSTFRESGCKKNRVSQKGGYLEYKLSEKSLSQAYVSKKKSFTLDLTGYETISIELRVKNKKGVPDFAKIGFTLSQWEGQELWVQYWLPRVTVPSDENWYRVYIPVEMFVRGLWGKPKAKGLDHIFKVAVEVCSELPVEILDTDIRNLAAWKVQSDEIKVEPLEE